MMIIDWLQELTFWHWMVLGTVLVILELILPGVWFLWLGLGAITTGLIVFLTDSLVWELQLVIFGAFSVIGIIIGRLIMQRKKAPTDHPNLNRRGDQYIGKVFILENASENGSARVKIGDTSWAVRLQPAGQELQEGARVSVIGLDGATLNVEAAGSE
jgi:hypothetical protein